MQASSDGRKPEWINPQGRVGLPKPLPGKVSEATSVRRDEAEKASTEASGEVPIKLH